MQTSGGMRREIVKSYLRRMGRAKRNPSPHAPALAGLALMGFAFALPILPDGMMRRDSCPSRRGRRTADAKGGGGRPDHVPGHGTRIPGPVTARPALISGSRISLW